MMRASVQLGVGAEATALLLREAKHQRPAGDALLAQARSRRLRASDGADARPAAGYRSEHQSEPAESRCRNRESRRPTARHRTSATPRAQPSCRVRPDDCRARMMRKSNRLRSTSDAALLLIGHLATGSPRASESRLAAAYSGCGSRDRDRGFGSQTPAGADDRSACKQQPAAGRTR
jgi:hypothetical protein